ncbi:hypothetical protein B0H13DRAFT_2273539 [Mycena leptocephala]|nr:hypothetical protein B0H13DRAFT_2273539 [Mycena leptocephala]
MFAPPSHPSLLPGSVDEGRRSVALRFTIAPLLFVVSQQRLFHVSAAACPPFRGGAIMQKVKLFARSARCNSRRPLRGEGAGYVRHGFARELEIREGSRIRSASSTMRACPLISRAHRFILILGQLIRWPLLPHKVRGLQDVLGAPLRGRTRIRTFIVLGKRVWWHYFPLQEAVLLSRADSGRSRRRAASSFIVLGKEGPINPMAFTSQGPRVAR